MDGARGWKESWGSWAARELWGRASQVGGIAPAPAKSDTLATTHRDASLEGNRERPQEAGQGGGEGPGTTWGEGQSEKTGGTRAQG